MLQCTHAKSIIYVTKRQVSKKSIESFRRETHGIPALEMTSVNMSGWKKEDEVYPRPK